MTTPHQLSTFGDEYPSDPTTRKRFHDIDGNIDYLQVTFFFILLISTFVILAIIYLTYIEDNPPMVVNSAEVLRHTAEPGQTVSYVLDFCKHTNAAPDRRRTWINGVSTLVPGPDDPPSNKVGCFKFPIGVDVPKELFPDNDYYLFQTFTYQVNPLAERTVEFTVGPFHIIEPEDIR
jgi:hypothetical protein